MPLTDVSIRSLILMKPRSVNWTPSSLMPMSSTTGARPAATRTFSTSRSCFFPPTSMLIVTEFFPIFTLLTFAPDRTSIFRFLKLRVSSVPQSASSSGRIPGRTSISVTWVPNAVKTSANSQPTAPAPMIAIVLGAFSRMRASSEEITVDLLSSRPIWGRPLTREPVEITIAFFASCFSSLPSAFTLTEFLPTIFAVPLIQVILFFLNRYSTPFEF